MVFSDRKFIVVRNKTDNPAKYDALVNLIKAHGGDIVAWDERADGNVSPKLIIVASSIDYERAEEMKRLMIPTVTEEWIHACIHEKKLIPMRPYSPDPRNFMRDVIACFSDLSAGDTDVLKAGIVASGGECSDIVTRYTSHVIATKLETPECQLVLQSKQNNPDVSIKLTRPEWIDACMSLKVKVDDTPYLLTDDASNSQSHISQTQNLTGTFPIKDSPRLAVQQSMREGLGSDILDNRIFFLGDDLDLSDRVGKTVNYLIETNGGRRTNDLHNAQVYIGKWREGEQYIQASTMKLIVGNITWLYWVMIHQKFEKPNHLLHYPEVKGGLIGMRDYKICITNYTGDARAYLQSLIVSLGATYSGKLIENHTTHLVSAYESGQKYEAAKRWGIPVVNHLWLEDSYAYWQVQDPTSRIFTYFSPKLSMSTLIGTRNLVANVLNKFRRPEELQVTREHHEKRQAKQRAGNWLHDAMIVENEFHEQLRKGKIPLAGYEDDTTMDKDDSNTDISTHPPPLKPNQHNVEDDTKQTSANPEIKDTILVRKVRKSGVTSQSPNVSKKQKTSHEGATQSISSGKAKSTSPSTVETHRRIMFSGVEEPPSNKTCAQLGLTVAKAPPVQILLAPRFLKTVKFLQSLAVTEEFLKPAWIEACIQAGCLLPTDKYRIDDPNLSRALANRQKLDGHRLFENLNFRLDPGLKEKAATFRDLVKAHNGHIVTGKGPSSPEDTIVIGEHKDQVPFSDFIESIHQMDPTLLKNT